MKKIAIFLAMNVTTYSAVAYDNLPRYDMDSYCGKSEEYNKCIEYQQSIYDNLKYYNEPISHSSMQDCYNSNNEYLLLMLCLKQKVSEERKLTKKEFEY